MAIVMLLTLVILANFAFIASDINYRLDRSVVPTSYDITIKPYLLATDEARQFTFDGAVQITLLVAEGAVSCITLHSQNLQITNAILYGAGNVTVQSFSEEECVHEAATDKLSLLLHNTLIANATYALHFTYVGKINQDLGGFFRARCSDAAGGSPDWIGVTQLQRINARSVFPCFDEPDFKAKFRMHINRPKQYRALFNTRLSSSERVGNDRYLDHFLQTPAMSSYLVAFIVSHMVERGDVQFSVMSCPADYNNTAFSYSVGRKVLQAYNEYTKVPYTELGNDIMQFAGSPVFPHNGMENWGLVIYSDSVLVQKPGYTDGWTQKQHTITIIAHETAHMWFGNSVTFAWWSYFWLNEAFARYYQYFLADQIYAQYQLDQQFIINQVHTVFDTDAVNTTQPLTSPEASVRTATEIAHKFSGITYAKGASLIRMWRNLMGHEQFDGAIREYLKANHLKNTVPADLFTHLKQHWPHQQQVNLDEFFYDWTEQVGFPVIMVNISMHRDEVTLEQKRFLLSPADGSDATLRYTTPITYTTATELDFYTLTPKFYLNKTQTAFTWQLEQPTDWIIFNLQQSNYYRVIYDTDTLQRIREALRTPQHGGIHVINRAQLVDDLLSFGRAGFYEYDEVFEFLEYLADEMEYLPWRAAFTGLQRVAQRLNVAQQSQFGKFITDMASKVYQKLTLPDAKDTVLDVYNRNQVSAWMCKYKHGACNKQALQAFQRVIESGVKPSPDLRETLYCAASREGGLNHYLTLAHWYVEERLESEKKLLLRAMACTRQYVQYHYLLILGEGIAVEHKLIALTPTYAQNPENVMPMFVMITATIEYLAKALDSWSSAAEVISNIADYFTTREEQQMLEQFITNKGELFGASLSTLQAAAKSADANLQWAEERLLNLTSYLETRSGGAGRKSLLTPLLLLYAIFNFLI